MLNLKDQKNLFRNHLNFLETHRGKVSVQDDAVLIESDRDAFTYAVAGESDLPENLLNRFKTIHVAPWNQNAGPQLLANGFQLKSALNYMVFHGKHDQWTTNAEIKVKHVLATEEMEAFSETQSRGFADDEEDFKEWHPWLRAANFRNINNINQRFYVGYHTEKPVGVTLLVMHEEIAGIYAVTTLIDYRKQGISTTIMKHAINDAIQYGCKTITLQVTGNSYAESFYQKLGFVSAFKISIFSK